MQCVLYQRVKLIIFCVTHTSQTLYPENLFRDRLLIQWLNLFRSPIFYQFKFIFGYPRYLYCSRTQKLLSPPSLQFKFRLSSGEPSAVLAAASRSGGTTLNLATISLTAYSCIFASMKQGKLASDLWTGVIRRSSNCPSPLSGPFD